MAKNMGVEFQPNKRVSLAWTITAVNTQRPSICCQSTWEVFSSITKLHGRTEHKTHTKRPPGTANMDVSSHKNIYDSILHHLI